MKSWVRECVAENGSLFPLRFNDRPLFFEKKKMIKISGVFLFFVFVFVCLFFVCLFVFVFCFCFVFVFFSFWPLVWRLVAKQMLKFVRKFIDWRVKQKILFEYRLQIWFFCNLAIGWLSKFPAEHQYPPPPQIWVPHPFPDYHLASYIKLSNMFNIIIILFLHFFHSIRNPFSFPSCYPEIKFVLCYEIFHTI